MKKDWSSICLAVFAASLPWQAKFILRTGEIAGGKNNFLEIALYASSVFLAVFIFLTIRPAFSRFVSAPKWSKIFLRILACLLIFDSAALLSTFFAVDRYLSLWHYLVFLEGAVLLLFSYSLRRELNWGLVIKAFLISMAVSAVLGVFQFTIQRVPEIKYLVAPHQVSEMAGESVVETSSGRLLRAYGSFDHPNIFGGVLVFALLLIIDRIFKAKTEQEWQILFLGFLLFFTALLMSFSRAALLAFFVALVVRGLFTYKREIFKLLMIVGVSLAIMMIFFGSHPDWLKTRIQATTRLENISINERVAGLQLAGQQIIKHPLTLLGLANYPLFFYQQVPDNFSWQYQPVHNVWLLMIVEVGLWATLAWLVLCLLIGFFDLENRPWAAPLVVALLVLSLFDHWLISLPLGILFSFFILSISSRGTIE